MMFMFSYSHTDVKRGEQNKHVGLDTCNQQFNQTYEQDHDGRAGTNPHTFEDESKTDKTQQYDVPRRDRNK